MVVPTEGLSVETLLRLALSNLGTTGSDFSPAAPTDAPVVPITTLSGFLGTEKTTLLKHLLEKKQGLQVGVIILRIW
jgi:hypothetical protein